MELTPLYKWSRSLCMFVLPPTAVAAVTQRMCPRNRDHQMLPLNWFVTKMDLLHTSKFRIFSVGRPGGHSCFSDKIKMKIKTVNYTVKKTTLQPINDLSQLPASLFILTCRETRGKGQTYISLVATNCSSFLKSHHGAPGPFSGRSPIMESRGTEG